MKILFVSKCVAACAFIYWPVAALSHVVLQERTATALSTYKAVFMVGHGCDGSATNQIKVSLPPGMQGVRPMPKPGWSLSTKLGKLAVPFDNGHGGMVTEGVAEVTWTANAPENFLLDAYYDEFVLRGRLPKETGPIWFKVLQGCEKGSTDWAEIPASGTSTKGLRTPAALLEILPAK
jgi:periplasmic copper chaperone A